MKKILIALVVVAYAVSAFLCTKFFEAKELAEINGTGQTVFTVTDWRKNESPDDKLQALSNLAHQEKVNIYKLVYKPVESTKNPKIVIYAAIGNPIRSQRAFPLQWGKRWNRDDRKAFLSSIRTSSRYQTGQIALFNPNIVVEIRPMTAAREENLRGVYWIDSRNRTLVDHTKEQLRSVVGLQISDQPTKNALIMLADQQMTVYLIAVLGILLFLIALSDLYYVLLNYKALAVRKLFGFSNPSLIFKHLVKENVRIHAVAFLTVLFVQAIFLVFYNGWNRWMPFAGVWFIWQFLFTGISVLFGLIPFLMVYLIRIGEMLKNRKPLKLVQFLNYVSKLIFSFILLMLFLHAAQNNKELRMQKANHAKWEEAMHYAFYELQDSWAGEKDRENWVYQTGKKCQILFKLASEKGAMLVKPSDGIVFNGHLQTAVNDGRAVKPYDPDLGNVLQVNRNYLKDNPVYDVNGRRVNVTEASGHTLIVLVPEKFQKDEADIRKTYKEWFRFKKYIDDDLHMKRIGKQVPVHKNVQIKIRYIQNGQKHFLYHPDYEKENNNYSKDSVLIVIGPESLGGDSYLNYLSSRYFFPYVKDTEHPYDELKSDIETAGLGNTILTAPLLYSVVDAYLYHLQSELRWSFFLMILIVIMELIVTIFMTFNHLERNKTIHAVKWLHGYSSLKRHGAFFAMIGLFWFMLLSAVMILSHDAWEMTFFLVPALFAIELGVTVLVVRTAEMKKIKDVLKGA